MSEGGEDSAPAEEAEASGEVGGENLEERVDTEETRESNASYSSNSSDYDNDSEYDSKETEYEGEGNSETHKGKPTKRFSAKSQTNKESSKDSSELEEKLEGEKGHLYELLISQGASEEEAEELLRDIEKLNEREDYPFDIDFSKYTERVTKYGDNVIDVIKGCWYLFLALTDISQPNDPYKEVDEGANIIYLTGMLGIPTRDGVENFEKALGEKVSYVRTTDIHEIHKLLQYAKEKNGNVKVVGFSDGGKTLDRYISEYGDSLVSRFYAVAANPLKSRSNKITQVIGSYDRLATLEPNYTYLDKDYKGRDTHVVKGGHTWFIYDPVTNGQLADIVNRRIA